MNRGEVWLAQVNCDGLHTVAQATLTSRVAEVGPDTMQRVCSAVSYALGC